MSDYEEENFLAQIDKWDTKRAKHDFLEKMNRKLNRKEHFGR